MKNRLLCLLALFALPLTPLITPCYAQWQGAQPIETEGGSAWSPRIAMDGSGNATAVWVQNDWYGYSAWGNTFSGTSWSSATRIDLQVEGGNTWSSSLRLARKGSNSYAVWLAPGGMSSIYANYNGGYGWAGATSLASSFYTLQSPTIGVDASGTATAAWIQYDEWFSETVVWAARGSASSWNAATRIQTVGGDPCAGPEIAVAPSGDATVVWGQSDGVRCNVWTNRFSVSGGWGTATSIESGSGTARSTQIAMDSLGNAIAVWSQHDGVRYSIYSNRYTNGAWGTYNLIETDNAGDAKEPRISMDSSGNAIAAWIQNDGTRDNIWASRYTVGVGWGTPTLIETSDAPACCNLQVAMNSQGNATVVWEQGSSGLEIWSNRYIGNGWGAATLIGSAPATTPDVVLDSNGNAIAVFPQHDGVRYNILANRFIPPASSANSCDFESTYCDFGEQSKVSGEGVGPTAPQSQRRSTFFAGGRTGLWAVRLHTEPGDDHVNGSNLWERNDLIKDVSSDYCHQGQEEWWAHSILFPNDFVFPPGPENGAIFDFHHDGSGGQANMELQTIAGTGLRLELRGGPCCQGEGNRLDVLITDPYGAQGAAVTKNQWYDFVYHVKWSSGNDGFFHAWLNGRKIVTAPNRATLYAGTPTTIPCYLKLANYHAAFGQPSSVVHDRVVRGSSAAQVALQPLDPE